MRPGTATRGNRASRRRACVPWRDGGKSPRVRSWSSCDCEIRASLSGDDGWVGMCASALQNCAPHWQKVRWGKPKVYRLGPLGRNCGQPERFFHRWRSRAGSVSLSHFLCRPRAATHFAPPSQQRIFFALVTLTKSSTRNSCHHAQCNHRLVLWKFHARMRCSHRENISRCLSWNATSHRGLFGYGS
jgi:hypothetical protein